MTARWVLVSVLSPSLVLLPVVAALLSVDQRAAQPGQRRDRIRRPDQGPHESRNAGGSPRHAVETGADIPPISVSHGVIRAIPLRDKAARTARRCPLARMGIGADTFPARRD